MNEKQKIKKAEEMFLELMKMFGNNVSINIHEIKSEKLPKKWENHAGWFRLKTEGYSQITLFKKLK